MNRDDDGERTPCEAPGNKRASQGSLDFAKTADAVAQSFRDASKRLENLAKEAERIAVGLRESRLDAPGSPTRGQAIVRLLILDHTCREVGKAIDLKVPPHERL